MCTSRDAGIGRGPLRGAGFLAAIVTEPVVRLKLVAFEGACARPLSDATQCIADELGLVEPPVTSHGPPD